MTENYLRLKRIEIDKLDKKIMSLLKERFALMPEIARHKKNKGLNICQKEREDELLEKRKALAKELNIDEKFTEEFFRLIIAESKRIQRVA